MQESYEQVSLVSRKVQQRYKYLPNTAFCCHECHHTKLLDEKYRSFKKGTKKLLENLWNTNPWLRGKFNNQASLFHMRQDDTCVQE